MFTIGIYEKSIRFLETNKDNKISFAFNLTENFHLDNLCNQNKQTDTYANEIASTINDILEKSKTTSLTSKLVFDSNLCFSNVIPLDFSEAPEKISSNILWELSNYFPDNYKSHKISYHKLNSEQYSENIKDTLIIAIKNNLIDTIKRLSGLINIKITSIGIEHFASENYFRTIRKNLIEDDAILIIGCKRNRFDFSIINKSGCFAFDYLIIKDFNFQEPLIKEFNKIESKYDTLKINNIYLYGDETTSTAYNVLNQASKKSRLILSNPFYELGITDNVEQDIISEGYKFIPLCGLALK